MPFVGDDVNIHVHVHAHNHGPRDRKRTRSDTDSNGRPDGLHAATRSLQLVEHASCAQHLHGPKRTRADDEPTRPVVAVTVPPSITGVTSITNITNATPSSSSITNVRNIRGITDGGAIALSFNFLISPCSVCSRRPNKKTLDCFSTCGLCGLRACYVCKRQCRPDDRDPSPPAKDTPETHTHDADAKTTLTDTKMDMDVDVDVDVDVDENRDQDQDLEHTRLRLRLPLPLRRRRPEAARTWPPRHGGSAREVPAGMGHADVVCSRCCVEGDDGRITCLGCLPRGMEA